MNSFYKNSELSELGFMKFGRNVLISKKASFYSPEKISIGNNVRIDDFCILSGTITLNDYIHISAYSALYGQFGIFMDDFTGLSPRCTIFSASDDFNGDFLIGPMSPHKYTNIIYGQVIIKKFSHVGSGSVIMPNLTINEGVAVGALSFVKKSLNEWGIYAGNPLKFIKPRNKGLLKYYDEIINGK